MYELCVLKIIKH